MMKKIITLVLILVPLQVNTYFHLLRLPPKDNWLILIEALIAVESGGNNNVTNSIGATGCLQIMPIYIKEVNRILGIPMFNIKHAKSRTLAIKMFNIYQSKYNPKRNIRLAIKLHNPGAGDWYLNKVLDKYNKLKLNEKNSIDNTYYKCSYFNKYGKKYNRYRDTYLCSLRCYSRIIQTR